LNLPANIFIPSRAYININIISRSAKYANDPIELIMTLMIILIIANVLTSLAILKTLKVLSILKVLNILSDLKADNELPSFETVN